MEWNLVNVRMIRTRLMELRLSPDFQRGISFSLLDAQGHNRAEDDYRQHRLADMPYHSIILGDYIGPRMFYYIEKCPKFYVATRFCDEHEQKIVLSKTIVREIEEQNGKITYSFSRMIFHRLDFMESRFGI